MKTLLLDGALVVTGGVLYGLACPPHDLRLAAWVTLVPLLAVAARASARGAFAAGFAYGTVFFSVTVAWVLEAVAAYFQTGLLGALGFSAAICLLFVSIHVGLFAVAARTLLRGRRWIALVGVPGLWIACELARSTLLTGLPWELLGHSQWQSLHLIQIADLGGAYAVSFLVAIVNVGVYLALRELAEERPWRPLLPLASTLALVVLTLAYGSWRLHAEAARPRPAEATVTIVQGNQPPSWTWDRTRAHRDLVRYTRLTDRALDETAPDLVVWPEYALTLYPHADPVVTPTLERLAHRVPAGLVLGAPRTEGRAEDLRYFNSVFHVAPGGRLQAYDKIRLVPFAEYRPYGLREAFAADDGERRFGAGARSSVLSTAIGRLGPLICYEVVFPHLTRALVHAGAEILVNVANDGWLDRSGLGASAQHLSMTVFRAIESRRYIVRATTSGVSAFVDPAGRPFGLLAAGETGATAGRVHARHDRTLYSRYGDVFALLATLVGFVALAHARSFGRVS